MKRLFNKSYLFTINATGNCAIVCSVRRPADDTIVRTTLPIAMAEQDIEKLCAKEGVDKRKKDKDKVIYRRGNISDIRRVRQGGCAVWGV